MSIQTEKIELIKLILDMDNVNLLTRIKDFLQKKGQKDFWDTLSPEEKDDIFLGLDDIKNNDIVEDEEFIKKFR